ncbi:MAG: VWA domain-containing protein, partial [Planctomycetales bacterium]|nr:VWA domain-containing protein [Planctomycetales bacterium]
MAELVEGGGGETKMDAAREAVRGLLATLRPSDTFLLVPFRGEALAPSEVPGRDPASPTAATALAALTPGGPTRIRPGIEAALSWLRGRTEPARHLVVLSDGRDEALASAGGDREPVAAALRAATAERVGLTALEAGGSAVLQELLRAAGGRGLPLASFRDLSEALRRELLLARGDLEWRGPARPVEAKAAADVLGDSARAALANPP